MLPRHRSLLEAIASLQEQGAYQRAIRQAEAAYRIGQEESNEELMARARLLRAESFLALDSTRAENQIVAIRDLRESALLFQEARNAAAAREQRLQRNFFFLLAGAVLILAFAIWSRYRNSRSYQRRLKQKNSAIEAERRRSDELLRNILPRGVARELKTEGKASARRFEFVSVLFADFAGFSKLAGALEPEELITRLDKAFRAFDRIVEEEGLEKIKTIGDAYMCAGGLPEPLEDHVERTVRAAFRMQDYLRTNPDFKARIGIHAGPVIAGVVGLHKFAYDIWGDTVNLAARLEEKGKTGKVNVSGIVCRRLPPVYPCKHRGKIRTKHLGDINMYFVERPGTK